MTPLSFSCIYHKAAPTSNTAAFHLHEIAGGSSLRKCIRASSSCHVTLCSVKTCRGSRSIINDCNISISRIPSGRLEIRLQYDYLTRKCEFKLMIALHISEVKLGNSCVRAAPAQKSDKYFGGLARLFRCPFERVIAVI